MGLTCKIGSYDQVIKALLDLNIPKRNLKELISPGVFLGTSIDILIQFTKLKSLDEFIEKWFNPIRMIYAEEALITKTLTLIVISEGPSFTQKPSAFLFLNTHPRNLDNMQKSLLSIPGVLSADTVFGPYDIICPVKVKNEADFSQLISCIQNDIPGIEGSMTAIVR